MARKELGEILREADLISEAQLAEALGLQKSYGERLASILVRQHILTEKFAVTYLGRQLGVPGVDLSQQEIDLALLSKVTLDLCEKNLVFPVKVRGTRLQLAMSDPLDRDVVAEIEFKTGVRLAPLIALDASIKNAIVEARRALKDGQKKLTPNVQRAAGGAPAGRRPAAVAVDRPPPVKALNAAAGEGDHRDAWPARAATRPSRPCWRPTCSRSRRCRPSSRWTTTRACCAWSRWSCRRAATASSPRAPAARRWPGSRRRCPTSSSWTACCPRCTASRSAASSRPASASATSR